MVPSNVDISKLVPTVPFNQAIKDAAKKEKEEISPDILQNAGQESSDFYMDAARALSKSLSKVDSQIASQSLNYSDIAAIVSNKASIVARIVTLVEKSWEIKKSKGDTPKEQIVKEVLDKVGAAFDKLNLEGSVRDRFFMELSAAFEDREK